MPTKDDFALDDAVQSARKSIAACVIVGGSLFAESTSLSALRVASKRGVLVRLLFPSTRSTWLQSFAKDAGHDPASYCERVGRLALRTTASLPGAYVRRYDAPGPCWFVLVDGAVLFTKPFNANRATVPVRERMESFITHYGMLFEQLWERAVENSADEEGTNRPVAIEPLIRVVTISQEIIARLAANPADLAQLSPEGFEVLIADRLSAMGLGVRRVRSTNAWDGGIDMVAWPERNASIPYLLAVQAKHSRVDRAVPQSVVRDLRGVLSTAPFDVGLVVTNTRFSPNAHWYAEQGPKIVRLRGFEDLVRWLRADFTHETIERDLPKEILLGPGLRVPIGSRREPE
jgi:hypothetical protein